MPFSLWIITFVISFLQVLIQNHQANPKRTCPQRMMKMIMKLMTTKTGEDEVNDINNKQADLTDASEDSQDDVEPLEHKPETNKKNKSKNKKKASQNNVLEFNPKKLPGGTHPKPVKGKKDNKKTKKLTENTEVEQDDGSDEEGLGKILQQ